MMRVYARTREREKAWKFGAACLAGSAVLAPLSLLIKWALTKKMDHYVYWSWVEVSVFIERPQ